MWTRRLNKSVYSVSIEFTLRYPPIIRVSNPETALQILAKPMQRK